MRHIILILALALPLSAQTITVEVDTTDAAQVAALAQIDSAKAVALAADAAVTAALVDSTVTAEGLDFSALGTVSIVSDTRDPVWVQVQLPLAETAGLAQILVGQALVEAKQDYGGKDSGTAGRVRMRHDRALDFLRGLDAALNP